MPSSVITSNQIPFIEMPPAERQVYFINVYNILFIHAQSTALDNSTSAPQHHRERERERERAREREMLIACVRAVRLCVQSCTNFLTFQAVRTSASSPR
jgi:hypothetical protein